MSVTPGSPSTAALPPPILETEKELRARKRKRKPEAPTHTAYEMVMSFGAEQRAANNFLLGQFRYRSDLGRYTVSLFDDREFIPARIPEAMVHLFSVDGERPAGATGKTQGTPAR